MKLTMLGTGHALVTECYNTCFVIEDDHNYFMVDGGGGNAIFRQLKSADIDWMAVRDIFVTHKHLDHLMGIIWMIRMICESMSCGEYAGEACIYAHAEVIRIIRDMTRELLLEKESRFIDERLHLIEVKDGESRHIIGHDISFFDIHSVKTKQFGFSMDMGNGEKITCCGDEPFNEHNLTYVENSKWLLHEAFCLYSEKDLFLPYQMHHSTVKDACEIAKRTQAQNIILYHTEDKNLKDRKRLYTEEGRQYYRGNIYVPDDLEKIKL